ncbi:G protein-coupled receptor 88 [Lepisosteus oculatus]|uniref:G protein-coupled receptor 88 n=1 Tax=Lepisosteus oculatus TaxID=7918 RepID=UPI003710C1B7
MKNASNQLFECEEEYSSKISLAIVYSLMCLSGTASNLLVIYLVLSFKKLRTASNAFIVNGCLADLLVCAFWMSHEAILISTDIPLTRGYHTFKEALLFLGVDVSLLSHSLIAVNRYVLITKVPATYLSIYQKRNTEWMIVVSWLAVVIILLPWLTAARFPDPGCAAPQVSLAPFARRKSILLNPYAGGTLALTILAQTIVILYCYFKIFRKVQISVKRVSILNFQIVNNLPYSFSRKDKRLGFYVLAVCCIFLLATQPLFWVLFLGLFGAVPKVTQTVSWMIFAALFVVNPFLYTWKNEEFRKSIRSVMRREVWRGSTVGVEPVAIHTVSQSFPKQNNRAAFSGEIN